MAEVNKDLDIQFDSKFSQEGRGYQGSEAFTQLVDARRSVRRFEQESIPDEVVEKCVDLALKAPNSSNLQPWEFYWLQSKEQRDKVAEFCLSQPAAATAPTLIVCVARIDTWRRNSAKMVEAFRQTDSEVPKKAYDYYQKLVPFVYTIGPLGILGRVKALAAWFASWFRPTPAVPANRDQLFTWAIKSTALGCQNLMMAFRSYGYDTCPMEGCDPRRIKRLLGLGRGAEVVMVISAGKRADGGVYGNRLRFDRELFIKRI